VVLYRELLWEKYGILGNTLGATQHWEPVGKMVRVSQWVNCVKGLYPKKQEKKIIVVFFQNIIKIVWNVYIYLFIHLFLFFFKQQNFEKEKKQFF
jgi:hypothetical protein